MSEWIYRSWSGWQTLNSGGKLTGLLLICMVYLWIYCREEKQKQLLIYTTGMAVFCFVPPTAAILMIYQTKFYDYQWIWSLVPMTVMISVAFSSFFTENMVYSRKFHKQENVVIVIGIVVLLLLCGNMGKSGLNLRDQKDQKVVAEQVLSEIRNLTQEPSFYLLAPDEILEYVRTYDNDILLLYGRNMWQEELNAYTYDFYSEDLSRIHQWLMYTQEEVLTYMKTPEERREKDREMAELILETEADFFLLPVSRTKETKENLDISFGIKAQQVGEYYLWTL